MIGQAGQAIGPVAAHPLRDGRARDLQRFGNTRLHPAILNYQPDELAASFRSQRGVEGPNARNEGLR